MLMRQTVEALGVVFFVRRHLCRGAEADSHGPVQYHRNSPVADVSCAGPALECRRGVDSRAPTVAPRCGFGRVGQLIIALMS